MFLLVSMTVDSIRMLSRFFTLCLFCTRLVIIPDAVAVVEIVTVGGDTKVEIAAEVGTKEAAVQAPKGIEVGNAQVKMEHLSVHQMLRLNR